MLAIASLTPSRQAIIVVGGVDSISIEASGFRRRSSAMAASATSARSTSSNQEGSANSASARARTAARDAAIRCSCSLARPSTSVRSVSPIRSLRAMSRLMRAPCNGVRNSCVADAAKARAASSAAPRRWVSSAKRCKFSLSVAATSSTSVDPYAVPTFQVLGSASSIRPVSWRSAVNGRVATLPRRYPTSPAASEVRAMTRITRRRSCNARASTSPSGATSCTSDWSPGLGTSDTSTVYNLHRSPLARAVDHPGTISAGSGSSGSRPSEIVSPSRTTRAPSSVVRSSDWARRSATAASIGAVSARSSNCVSTRSWSSVEK